MTLDERKLFDSLSTLILALPSDPDAQPLKCELTYLREEKASSGLSPIYLQLPLLRIERYRNGILGDSREFRLTDAKDLVTVRYPGDKLVLVFKTGEKGDEEDPIVINGPWSAIALIHKFNGQRTQNPLVWKIEMVIPYKGVSLSFWLQLKFEAEFPKLIDWPQRDDWAQ